MADYIDREAVKRALSPYLDGEIHQYSDAVYSQSYIYDALDSLPAADVKPVVRCKDCEYSDSIGGWCCSHGVCVDCIVPEDFYCAYGELRGRYEGDGQ